MTSYRYPVDLTPDETGRIVARAPDLIGCLTDGADAADALAAMSDAVEEALAAAMLARENIPPPSLSCGRPVIAPGAVMAAKTALYQAMRAAGISNVALAVRLGVQESEVRRMLDPAHSTKMGRLEQSLAILGERLTVSVDAAA